MTSAINPQNIDGAYPVAGQDNDSQGFRDNFTNTKTNFEYAAAEITDLQNNAVLKAALTGTTLNNNMGGSILSNAQLQDMAETRVSLPTPSPPSSPIALELNYAFGPFQTFTLPTSGSGTVNLTFANFPAAGAVGRMRVQFVVNSGALGWTLTLPAAVTLGTTGIQGLSGSILTFAAIGTYEFEFESNDTVITMFDLNRPLVAGFTNQLTIGSTLALTSGEDLAASAAANLAVTSSYFSTAAAETATLAAGATGQVKVFAMFADVGDMVITVSNAGWKTSGTGTITFSDIGQTATLMYINAKWFVIGQGAGASNTFAQFA